MITLYCFGRVFPRVIGETRDLRVEWALEEIGLPFRIHGVDHTGGEHRTADFQKLSPFQLIPVIDDDGFTVAESGAILMYLAEKSGRLIPADFQGRMRVMQWCFAALNTIERPMLEISIIDLFGGENSERRRVQMTKDAERWLEGLEKHLENREWVAAADFTIADILIASVLREIRKTDLMDRFPKIKSYFTRAYARPAWQRALKAYSLRLGVSTADIC